MVASVRIGQRGIQRKKLDRFVADVLGDYFPRPVSILDRDLCLSLVQDTLDYGLDFGLNRMPARDVLVVGPDSVVRVVPPPVTPTLRSVYLAPVAIVRAILGLRARPLDWVHRDLEPILRAARDLRTKELANATDAELLGVAMTGIKLRDDVFNTRRPHFLPSFLAKIIFHLMTGWRKGSTTAADLSGYDYPTARFRKDLESLTVSVRGLGPAVNPENAAVRKFIAENGGRGQTFVPLVSDCVWDVFPQELLGLLPALVAASGQKPADGAPAGRHVGRITRRLREIAVARDWVTYGFEQTTRAIRDPLLMIGTRLAERGVLAESRDVLHLRLDELREVVRGGAGPSREVIAARRAGFQAPVNSTAAAGDPVGLRGVGASPGEYSGVARVVRNAGSAELQPGEILVCEMTSPSWLPLLMIAGAVVTDRGGVLSHAAIVAREFGIPAVTGTGTATTSMISGTSYRVDGRSGAVAVSP
jgi:phosphohistidine swiveling domain-containing protein